MPDQPVLESLALTGATTVAAAMATDAWHAVRDGTARLFRRHNHAGQAEVEAQLDGDALLVAQARDADEARRILAGAWRLRLAALLREHPEAAADLAGLIDAVRAGFPVSRVQVNSAAGGGAVYAVQDGSQVINNQAAGSAADQRG
jgi:hypothetical protein